ncbi:MAG: PEP-CTERM sorting domain-containing protein [Bryobacterales bacterium]|nr:PEP-CTERM sorting domain-containing protein [Bryobacterales bacterium]
MQLLRTAIAAVVFLAPAFGDPIKLVVPFGNTSVPGNTTDGSEDGVISLRAQAVYGRGQFLGAGISGPVLITSFAFRTAPGTGPASLSATALSIYASTTQYAPNSSGGNQLLTDTFTTNLGADNTLVYSGSLLTLSSPGCAGPAVCPFDLVFAFATPFLYDPTQGFLLLDLHMTGISGTGTLDAREFNAPGGSIATLYGILDSPTGLGLDLGGDITQFTLEAVPEPSSGVLLLGGLGALLLRRRMIRRDAGRRRR